MTLANACIMLHGPREGSKSPAGLGSGTQLLTILLDNVDTHDAHSKLSGAPILEELHETVYGERQYATIAEEATENVWL